MTVKKSRTGRRGVRLYEMRDLNQRTTEVIQQINESGEPAIITRQGRFVAIISPLRDRELEGKWIAEFLEREAAPSDDCAESHGTSTDDVARRLGIDWPD
jgi:antitoxin (DNA-binding transcriptional repressor) of toxin-antitoxin stability system